MNFGDIPVSTIFPRVSSSANPSTLSVNSDSFDLALVTGQAQAITINAPTGTPNEGQRLTIKIVDNGTARAITWNAVFQAGALTLPANTLANVNLSLICEFEWSSTFSKWRLIRVNT